MRKLTIISLSVIIAASGCTVIPGSGLPTGNKTIVYNNNDEPGNIQSQLDSRVSIHPITFSLVQSMAELPKISQHNQALEQQKRNYNYRLGKGDVLNIVVWYQPDMTTQGSSSGRSQAQQVSNGSWVSDRGTIFYPLVGELKVEGKTIDQVRSELDSRLRKYIKNPQIDLTVSERYLAVIFSLAAYQLTRRSLLKLFSTRFIYSKKMFSPRESFRPSLFCMR